MKTDSTTEWFSKALPARSASVDCRVMEIVDEMFHPAAGGVGVKIYADPTQWLRLIHAGAISKPHNSDVGVVLRDAGGVDTVYSAKVHRDDETGAVAIRMGARGDLEYVLKQGGFRGHVPVSIYRDSDGRWQVKLNTSEVVDGVQWRLSV